MVLYHNWRHAFNVCQLMFAMLTVSVLSGGGRSSVICMDLEAFFGFPFLWQIATWFILHWNLPALVMGVYISRQFLGLKAVKSPTPWSRCSLGMIAWASFQCFILGNWFFLQKKCLDFQRNLFAQEMGMSNRTEGSLDKTLSAGGKPQPGRVETLPTGMWKSWENAYLWDAHGGHRKEIVEQMLLGRRGTRGLKSLF